ncbi:MAG: hypothetical protein IPP43_06835 [Chitinophagaceae bacterium]|nr:hypothetical protein [Chitinophagaceae bacterium]
MEVHAHTHTPRKKWTHYFWEFLMLFLAVFCGFLAENQREHFVEAQRAKEYAKSLLSDMKEDTVEISGGIFQNTFMIEAFDSCVSIGLKNIDNLTVPGVFYYYSRFSTNAYAIDWNKSTLTQLVQSGNLRYFKNKELVRKINKYYSLQSRIGSNNDADHLHRNRIVEIRDRLLAARYYEVFAALSISIEMKGHVSDNRIDSLMAQQLPLKPGSTGVMEEYLNNLMDRKWRNKTYVDKLYPEALKMAEEIIEMLKEDYHFK